MDTNMYGELPTHPVVFAACDSGYFIDHAIPFITSSSKAGFNTHVHVVNPTDEVLSMAGIINGITTNDVTYTFEDRDLSKLNTEQERAYYACLRFFALPHILPSAKEVLVLDIDCMVMQEFAFPETSCAYFPRHNEESQEMKVAAGAVYLKHDAMNVAKAIVETIGNLELKWFVDQIALTHIFNQIPAEHITEYDNNFMDWEFVEDTCIWTGKGPRKYDNTTYVGKKNHFTTEYNKRILSCNKVLLKPRLDIPFKKFGLERKNHAPLPEIRTHWEAFANKVSKDLTIEMPRWMFNSTIESMLNPEAEILVPHVEKHNWGGHHKGASFYMQTVFPWLFTIDKLGWSGGLSVLDTFEPSDNPDETFYNTLKEYIKAGGSKFPQPDRSVEVKEPYIFVPLQLPHDETIKYHSDISVEEYVEKLCKWADSDPSNPIVVFKGHPINIESMVPLKKITRKYKRVQYHLDVSIHKMIEAAEATYVINSGTGQEAMLHDASVVCFGRCEYEAAVINGNIDDLDKTWSQVKGDDKEKRKQVYRSWYEWYSQILVDTYDCF